MDKKGKKLFAMIIGLFYVMWKKWGDCIMHIILISVFDMCFYSVVDI
jgi:hypothetical protein